MTIYSCIVLAISLSLIIVQSVWGLGVENQSVLKPQWTAMECGVSLLALTVPSSNYVIYL